ncbi:hypothetical protein BGZ94_004742 [Podila epigama]|nr:hypothetical protein BGZ94_004742 [Podila epigama]
MPVPFLIMILLYFYNLLPDTKIYQQQQQMDAENRVYRSDGSVDDDLNCIIPGMPMANNLVQVLEWIACGLGEGVHNLMADAILH